MGSSGRPQRRSRRRTGPTLCRQPPRRRAAGVVRLQLRWTRKGLPLRTKDQTRVYSRVYEEHSPPVVSTCYFVRVMRFRKHRSAYIPALLWDRLLRASHSQACVEVWPVFSPSLPCGILLRVFVYFLLPWARICESWA